MVEIELLGICSRFGLLGGDLGFGGGNGSLVGLFRLMCWLWLFWVGCWIWSWILMSRIGWCR